MKKTGIMTDSHSGILENEASKLGIAVLPMPFYIDEKLYLELERLSKEVKVRMWQHPSRHRRV